LEKGRGLYGYFGVWKGKIPRIDRIEQPSNCLKLNHTEASGEKEWLRNRCLIFDDTEQKLGMNEYEQSKRIRKKDASAVRASAGARLQKPLD
jgi:hypothetical protein